VAVDGESEDRTELDVFCRRNYWRRAKILSMAQRRHDSSAGYDQLFHQVVQRTVLSLSVGTPLQATEFVRSENNGSVLHLPFDEK
jgi:hypothetical protein